MVTGYLGLVWLMSLFVAAFLGYDRGRWLAGLLLGLLFGPLGVVAAGLMQPSAERTAARGRAIQRHIAYLQRVERIEARERRKEKMALDAFVHDVEEQFEHRDVGFAEGLRALADELESASGPEPLQNGKLRTWVGWLHEKAEEVHTSPRYTREEL